MRKCLPLAIAGPCLFTQIFVKGRVDAHKVPRSGPLLVAANHSSLIDGVILTSHTGWIRKGPIHTIAYSEPFRHWFMGYMLKSARCIPFDRANLESQETMLRLAVGYLKMGEAVGIFPEGHLNSGRKLRRPRQGVAVLALETGSPILPVGIRRSHELFPLGAKRPKVRRMVTLHYGDVIDVSGMAERYHQAEKHERSQMIRDVLARTMHAIADLSGLKAPRV